MFFTDAFVLSYKNVNEFDRRYSLLTEDFGRIEALVKSIQKPNSKLAGHLEPPSFCWLELIEIGNGFQLTQALTKQSFLKIRENREALSLTFRLADFLNRFVDKDPNDRIFCLLKVFFDSLEQWLADGIALDFDFQESQIKLKFLKELGFLPELQENNFPPEFIAEYQEIVKGKILPESVHADNIKKIALDFVIQAENYMV